MAEARNPLKGQNLENVLGILGQALDVGGKFVFGPNANLDFGAPVKMAAGLMKEKREQKNLMDTLANLTGEVPEIAPMLQQAQGVMQQGGLINALQSQAAQAPTSAGEMGATQMPGSETTPQTAAPQAQAPITTETPETVPPTTPLTTPQPSAPSTSQGPVDLSSDQFLLSLIQGAPHLAEPLLKSRVGGGRRNDAIAQTLAALKLQSFETPEEKRAAQLKAAEEATDRDINKQRLLRQEEAARQAEKLTPKEEQNLNDIDGLLSGLNTVEQDINAGISSDLVLGNVASRLGPTGDRIVQAISPKKSLAFKNMAEQTALFQKAISGAAVSEPEARRLSVTRPQPTDSVEVQRALVGNLRKKTNELKLIQAANIANRMKQSGGVYRGPLAREAELYNLVREQMNKDFSGALKNKDIQAIRRELGIDYGYTPATKK